MDRTNQPEERTNEDAHSNTNANTSDWGRPLVQGKTIMKRSVMLTITSLLSILFMTFHLSDDIRRGFEPGGVKNIIGVLMLVVWLYGTTVLAGRRSGYIIMLLGAILGSGVPVVHMMGVGLVGGRIAKSSGIFFWV